MFIAAALVCAVWAYLHVKQNRKPTSDPLKHLPKEALCVIQAGNFKELVNSLTHQNLIWQAMDSVKTICEVNEGLQYFDSLLNTSDELSALLQNNTLYHATYKSGQLMVFGLKEHTDAEGVQQFFESHFKKQSDLSQPVYLAVVSAQQEWYLGVQGDLVFISSAIGLLQQAATLDAKGSLAADSSYTGLRSLDNERFCKIYFPGNSGIFNARLMGGASMLNMEVNPNSLNFTGYNKPAASSGLSALQGQKAASIGCLDYLPVNTICFTTKITGQGAQFFGIGASPRFAEQWQELNDSALYNIRKETEENLAGEFTELSYAGSLARESMLLFSIRDEDKCRALLELISDSLFTGHAGAEALHVAKIAPRYNQVFGKTAEAALVVDNYLMVFSAVGEAQTHLSNMAASAVLSKDPGFKQFADQNLLQDNNFVYYENPVLSKKYRVDGLLAWSGLQEKQDKLSHLCFTALSSKGAMLVRLSMEYRQMPSSVDGQSYLWVLNADTTISTPAFPFKNHLSGENELSFQDARNTLYLANATGSILWKKKINEPVRSKIYMVDIFRNNKYQLFFNTDNYLHLVDRNGNYVQGYPVRLPAKATAPVAVFDYENNKDCRLLIACADHKVYSYTLYGVKTEGYAPFRTDAQVELPVQYVKAGPSDYLVAVDKEGRVYGFSRKGEGRLILRNTVPAGLRNFYIDAGNSIQSTRLVYVNNKDNMLCKLSLADQKEQVKLDNDIAGFEALYDRVNDDKQTDVILYGAGGVYAYDLFGSRLTESYSSAAVYAGVVQCQDADENSLLAYDKSGHKIDVILLSGKLKRSLNGASQMPIPFQLFNDHKTWFIVADGSGLKCTR